MKLHIHQRYAFAGIALTAFTGQSLAQNAGASGPEAAPGGAIIGEVIVTAQKREESINRVPMSIAAQSAAQLENNGVRNAVDLPRVVPTLTVAQAPFGASVFSLRGIGYYDQSLAGSPAVSLYLDQAPLPFPAESAGVLFDVERVEVLKGPQGLLFGQNSTGGAINIIAAKPTKDFSAGVDLGYGRFDTFTSSAFVSGPLTDTLGMRIAVQTEQGGDWQKSYTRNDTLGKRDLTSGRVLFDWNPSSGLRAELNLNGWVNGSDTQAGQYVAKKPSLAAGTSPIFQWPFARPEARAADWGANNDYGRDDSFAQANLRVDYDLTSAMTLTSLTSYNTYKSDYVFEADGTPFRGNDFHYKAKAHTFYEELRLAGNVSAFEWLLGAQYERDVVYDSFGNNFQDSTLASVLGYTNSTPVNTQVPVQRAAFANLDWHVTPDITLRGGMRYTKHTRPFDYCYTSTDAVRGPAVKARSDALRAAAGLPPGPPAPTVGDCLTLDQEFLPNRIKLKIDEDNVAWRVGADWQVAEHSMVYAYVSRGYKAGAFPAVGASTINQLYPIKQESILAYEAGFKLALAQGIAQLNGAVYHYDYDGKQILGFVIDPIQGALNTLVSIPKSTVDGAELELTVQPITGLNLKISGTYTDARVTGSFINPDAFGTNFQFDGSTLPRVPKWAGDLDAEYDWPLGAALTAFVGTHVNYADKQSAAFASPADPRSSVFFDPARTLIDARAGLGTDRWRVMAWGRNITNEYYYSVYSVLDTIDRMAGRPVTYGVDVSFKFE